VESLKDSCSVQADEGGHGLGVADHEQEHDNSSDVMKVQANGYHKAVHWDRAL